METTTFGQVAGMVAWFGVLGMVVAALNLVALRVVRVDEVPSYVQGRIRWWSAHNSTFLLISMVVTVAGLLGLATA
jgi:hypothetical protein